MCHEHMPHDWSIDEETTADEETPSFLNDEAETETELVTDGGDDE